MDVTGTSAATSNSGSAAKALSTNFDMFLKLLTAQLQNQDPLEPMDASEFTKQLVQYSSVEQGIYTNKNLETLISLQQQGGLTDAVSYIGKDVSALSAGATLSGGNAAWSYTLPRQAANVSMTVQDAAGKTVFSGTGPTAAGVNTVTWDGMTNAGVAAPDGVYTLSITARDSADQVLTAPITLKGRVTAADLVNGDIVLTVGGVRVKLSDIGSVREPTPAAAT